MISLSSAKLLVDVISGQTTFRPELNEDFAYLAAQHPPQYTAWYLLPAALIRSLRDRLAAWRYEQSLIDVWTLSPHLLDDIGVVLGQHDDRLDHLVAAPPRVVAHILAQGAALAEKTPAAQVWTAAPEKGERFGAIAEAA